MHVQKREKLDQNMVRVAEEKVSVGTRAAAVVVVVAVAVAVAVAVVVASCHG